MQFLWVISYHQSRMYDDTTIKKHLEEMCLEPITLRFKYRNAATQCDYKVIVSVVGRSKITLNCMFCNHHCMILLQSMFDKHYFYEEVNKG